METSKDTEMILFEKQFVWQPHGSQFTIIEEVPRKRLIIKVRKPMALKKSEILETLGFYKSWITIVD